MWPKHGPMVAQQSLCCHPPSRKAPLTCTFTGAGNRTRTGDLHLGKVAFYQLNYARKRLNNSPVLFRRRL